MQHKGSSLCRWPTHRNILRDSLDHLDQSTPSALGRPGHKWGSLHGANPEDGAAFLLNLESRVRDVPGSGSSIHP
jgi:hypothetical protein